MNTLFILARGCLKLVALSLCLGLLTVACSKSEPPQSQAAIQPFVANGARLPRLSNLPNGDVLMSWVQPVGNDYALKFAQLKNGHIVHQGEVAKGPNWFINWADFPSVTAISANFWLAHRLVKQFGGRAYDYDVVLSLSNDAGQTWRDIGSPHRDKTAAEHGFAAIFAEGDAAGIVWLDGREYVDKKDAAKYPNKSGNFSLRYTRIQQDGRIEAEQIIDNNTCTCCWPAVAVTPAGAIAAWRGRTNLEIRDNQMALLRNGKWTAPLALGAEGWKIDGCPVNGPALSAHGMHVAAAWFSAANDQPRVSMAFSVDGGKTFGQSIPVDNANPMGRIGLIWQDDNTAVVSWMTAASGVDQHAQLALRAISIDGKMGAVKRIANISTGRDTGVPQIAATEDGALLVWTDAVPSQGISQGIKSDAIKSYGIKTMTIPWEDLAKQNLLQTMSDAWDALYATKAAVYLASICTNKHAN